MALRLRGRRSLSLLNQFLYNKQKPATVFPTVSHLLHVSASPSLSSSTRFTTRPFTSTTSLSMSFRGKTFDPETDEIGPDTVLFEGCDYNHWLITIDFPKDANLSREQMIETYVNTAAQIFGSVDEAKKKIYALSTTTYQGFQVECTEETSEKFKGLPGVVFVLPDSYIDPVNKEYGGDKYVNGDIFPRPPPVHIGRRNYGDRRPREQNNYGPPPPQQNYGPPPPPRQQNYGQPPQRQQNYGPPPPSSSPPQQNFAPPPNQNFGVPPQQNFAPSPNQNFGVPPQQNFAPPSKQNFGAPPQQNYGPPPQQNYSPPPQQNYRPLPQQKFGNPPSQSQHQDYVPPNHQNYGHPQNSPPQQNYSPLGLEEKRGPMPPNYALGGSDGANQVPSYGGNFNSGKAGNQYPQGQQDFHPGNFPNHMPSEQKAFPQDNTYGAPQR